MTITVDLAAPRGDTLQSSLMRPLSSSSGIWNFGGIMAVQSINFCGCDHELKLSLAKAIEGSFYHHEFKLSLAKAVEGSFYHPT